MNEVKKLIINGEEFVVTDGGAIAFDATQSLSENQKKTARQNIGAAAVGEAGGGSADAVLYIAQALTDDQKAQARQNIGALGNRINETLYIAVHGQEQDAVIVEVETVRTPDDDLVVDVLSLRGDFDGSIDDDTVVLRGIRPGFQDNDAVNYRQFNTAVGDIETALDAIISIQNSLIGGDGA